MSGQAFEIGLVGAGAISAGAYTGGVLDFLVHALDAWYAAKGTDPKAPPHDVKLSVFSGASAGAISAVLGTAYLASEQPSIASEADAAAHKGENKLFDSWVERIDIAQLLQDRDLPGKDSPVVSLLDSTVLAEIADSGLEITPRPLRRPYVAERFDLMLTVTNLRGVPYAFQVASDQPARYDMSLHADHVRFRLGESGPRPDCHCLDWAALGGPSPVKEALKLAALASGAFPIGLAPRTLELTIAGNGQPDWYSARTWPVPTPDSHDPHHCTTERTIPVDWGKLPSGYRYTFQCVDGGVMNNEPFELARRALAGGGRNPRVGAAADRAVLLIDPFPSDTAFDPEKTPAPDLLKLAMSLFTALKNQARFKPDELMLASQEDVYSRFMIAPSRDGEAHPIACGALGGFGGFLKRDFRAHDYFLGRRNAQKFLRDHFVLPENNPLFTGWDEDMRKAHCARDTAGQAHAVDGQRLLPIIPLVGAARVPCPVAQWPRYTQDDLAGLEKRLEKRVELVFDRLVNQYFKSNNPLVRFVAKVVLGRKKNDVLAYAREKVEADLRKMGLLR